MRTVLVLATFACVAAISHAAAQQPVDSAYYAGMRWRNIGPNRSGYISAVAGIPGDPTTYYVGTPEGGVWKTVSGGTTWQPIFDAIHVPSIGAVAVAPSAPNTVYVGTGNQSGWSFTPGNGIYKSTDAGKTWSNIGLRGSGYINTIVVDPANPDIVLVAAVGPRIGDSIAPDRGVYRSTNGGQSWTRVLPADGHGSAADLSSGAIELIFDYADPQVMYATLQAGGGIWKSRDGGVTWAPIGGEGLPVPTGALAVASGTHGQRLYLEVRGGVRGGGALRHTGIYRSDDGGATWTLGTTQIASAGGNIYADPQHPDVVYLMGTSMYRSVDGARHFESYMGAPSGADIRMLWIDATNPRRMLAGADQGPTISVDNGETWSPWYNMINGQFYRVSTDNDFPYHVCGPQQDSGTACVLSRSDFGEIRPNDWYPAGGFENGFIVADPLNPRWVYTQGWYHVLRRFDRTTSQVSVFYTPTPDDRFGGAPPLAFSPQDPHTLYMAAQYLLVSSDNAQSWRIISPDLTARQAPADTAILGRRTGPTVRGSSIQALALSGVSAGVIWVGTGNGLVQLTRDGGKSWHDVTPPNMAPGAINIIDAGHHDAGVAYVALLSRDNHPHIYRTTDFGQRWQEIVTGIADGAVVRVVREDPVNADLLYAGTVTSTYVSFDRGDHWQSLQLNLPNTVVSDMTVHGSDLVISTYGRGFWILDDVTPLRQARAATLSAAPAFLFAVDTASRIRWDNTQDTPLAAEVTVGQNPPEGAIIDYYLKAPVTGPIKVTITDDAGHVVREYTNVAPPRDTLMPNVPAYWLQPPTVLETTAGMHRVTWDLRYPTPRSLPFGYTGTLLDYTEFTLNWHSIPGQTPSLQPVGPLVVPGSYVVSLEVANTKITHRVIVTADPRVGVPQTALVAQLKLMQRMAAGLGASNDGFTHLEQLRAAIAALPAQLTGKSDSAEIATAVRALDSAIVVLSTGLRGFGPSNRDLARRLTDMEYGDALPTPSVIDAAETNCRDVDAASTNVRQLQAGRLAGLNALLVRGQIAALPTWVVPAGGACGAP
jgi:photosystem II stability/assembly factor-like uncharacterized protein